MSWSGDPLHDERQEQRSARRAGLGADSDRPSMADVCDRPPVQPASEPLDLAALATFVDPARDPNGMWP